MLLHTKKAPITKVDKIISEEPIFIHESKLRFTLHANKQDWERDLVYFRAMYNQLQALATKGNLKNGKQNSLKQQLFRMQTLINEDTSCLISRLDALAYDIKSSAAPKLGSIFQEFADLEEEFQLLRTDFRKLSVEVLDEINRVSPVRIY